MEFSLNLMLSFVGNVAVQVVAHLWGVSTADRQMYRPG